MAEVSLNHLYKVYPNGKKAVNDFNMHIEDKEFIVFVGPSGCGKSTTLRMIAGLEDISAGELKIGDLVVNDIEPKDRDIAMVFQNYALYPHMTVYENIAFGLKLRKLPKAEIHKKVVEAAEILGITEYLDKKPKEMSGGQRQRVALGRAIVREPKVMLLDEPLSNLDAKLRTQMRAEITKLHTKLQTTFIYVTHDQVEAMTMGTRIVVMRDGFVQQIDTPKNLYNYPVNKFVAGFIGTPQMNFFEATLFKKDEKVIINFDNCDVQITVPYSMLYKVQPAYLDGNKKVIIGLRAEDISLADGGKGGRIKVAVSHKEELGSETLIYGDINTDGDGSVASPTRIIIKDNSGAEIKTGQIAEVALNLEKLHIFDKETEQSVLPRIPEYNYLDCLVNGGMLKFCGIEIKLPEAIKCADGKYELLIPTDAINLDGEMQAEVISSENINGVELLSLTLGGKRIFAVSDGYAGGNSVKIGIDLKKISILSGGETVVSPLPEVNQFDCKFVRCKRVETVKGKRKKAVRFGFETAGVFFTAFNAMSRKIFAALGMKRAFKASLKMLCGAGDLKISENGIPARVEELLDYGKEKFLKCKAGGNTVLVKADGEYKEDIFLMPDFEKISVIDADKEIKIISPIHAVEFIDKLENLDTAKKTTIELYNEISALAMSYGLRNTVKPSAKNAYYLSMEYLTGRSFFNNLMELGVLDITRKVLADKGIDINIFEEIEDAALGNGGLGRLAACFLDSAAGMGLPLSGYGIRYKYGLFKQAIKNGFQVELPDDWQRFGDPWSKRADSEKRTIKFADMTVDAVPYDMPVFGKRINNLRLWQAEGSADAQRISEYLYPADDTEEGKILRLRQEYFFSAASVGELVEKHVKKYGVKFDNFSDFNVIQLNDTHPVLAIAEFIRILTSDYEIAFDDALKIAGKTFAYTNHTVLPEALECWSSKLLKKILPDIDAVLSKIHLKQKEDLTKLKCTAKEVKDLSLYSGDKFSMANLAVYVSKSVNGVAKIHTEILKDSLFKTAYKYYPEKFQNKTNGITQRRWLMLCNEELSSLLDRTIGKGWRSCISQLGKLNTHIDDIADEFMQVKTEKKRQLFEYIKKHDGVEIPENFIVYSQVKRLHEYKRQLMTAFAILEIYKGLKDGTIKDFAPSVFIFGAKSAPSYELAKAIIKFINEIAQKVNSDKDTNGLLRVVFISNYNVSYAEKIVAGSDVSLQVSTAGLEASGTGNMKFMMNGSVTCGTMDGANIEIVDLAGKENNYIFGAKVNEIKRLRKNGYDPKKLLKENELHNFAVSSLIDGTFSDDDTGYFKNLYDCLTIGASWHKPDNYFVLHDLESYVNALLKINADYKSGKAFAVKQLKNIANSAYFSSDRTIKEYAEDIWDIK